MGIPFLIVYGGGSEGGAVEYLLHLIANLDRSQFQPVFVSNGRDALASRIESLGVEYHVAGSPFGVARIARATRARFIHTHGVRANMAGRLAGLLTALPTLTTVHSVIALDYIAGRTRFAATFSDNLFLSLSRRVIAISHAIAEDVIKRGVKRDRVRVVYNGIPAAPESDREQVRKELGLGAETTALFTAARLHPVKGIDHLLDAVAQLDQQLPSWRLYIAGDGPLKMELEAQARSLGLVDRVRFLGHVQGVRRLLAGVDLYVSSSHMEGLGLSILEAMAASLPIVATGVGGVKELLEDAKTGLLVPPRDSRALATAVERLLTDRTYGQELAQAAYQAYRENFTVEQFARRTEAVYQELLSQQG